MRRALATGLTLAAAVAAGCAERLTAPGQCPDFCPGGEIAVVDTILRDVVIDDSAFRGYVRPHEAGRLLVASLPSIESRALVLTTSIATTYTFAPDTTRNPIVGVDSVRLQLIMRPDTQPLRNLQLHLHRVPRTIDSSTTYGDVAPSFSDSLVRSISLDSLLALPEQEDTLLDANVRRDSVTGDYLRVDTTSQQIILNLKLDSAQVPLVEADSGRLGLGVRITADSLASTVLGSRESLAGMSVTWYLQVDSLQLDTVPRSAVAGTGFDSFVFDPPPAPIDSTLAVGGMPVARSLLRFALPPAIRDSAQIVRATLVLVPDQPPQGVPADSFVVAARRVLSDLGAKSPLAPLFAGDSSAVGTSWVRIGSTDTLRIGVTQMLRLWAADTTVPAAVMLQQSTAATAVLEGLSLVEIRFRPASDTAFRPALHLTYVPRFRFGVP
ncbi:MAG: hypothetical protein ACREMJ_05365 [Gemmatimonadales bacterium]